MAKVEKTAPKTADVPTSEKVDTSAPETKVTPAAKRRLKVRISDILIFALIIAVVIGLSVFIINRLHLKNEVNQAKVTTDKVVAALAKQDTAKIRSYGDKDFQAKNTAASLNQNLTSTNQDGTTQTFADIYGPTTPTVVKQIVANNSKGQHVAIVYRYDRLKVPFYVRIDVTKVPSSDVWRLQALSASPDESKLLTK